MTIESWGLPLAITMLAVGLRCVVDQKYASLSRVVQAILLGLFFGSVTNLYLLDYIGDNGEILSHTKRAAYVGVSEPGTVVPSNYAAGWLTVNFMLVALIWWLVVRSAIYFRKGK